MTKAVLTGADEVRLGRGDRNDVPVETLVDSILAPLPVVGTFQNPNPELRGLAVYRIDIVDHDPDPRPSRVLPGISLREVQDVRRS